MAGPFGVDEYNATAILKWRYPCFGNGILQKFEGTLFGTHSTFGNVSERFEVDATEPRDLYSFKFDNLLPVYDYEVSLQAINERYRSNATDSVQRFRSPPASRCTL